MITKLWYSLQNYGDGSAYPKLMESEALCELDQAFLVEGWGEPCHGYFAIASEGPISVMEEEIATVYSEIAEVEEELAQDYMQEYKQTGQFPEWIKRLEDRLAALKTLKGSDEAS